MKIKIISIPTNNSNSRNSAKWHADGGHLFDYGGPYSSYPFGALGAGLKYILDENKPRQSANFLDLFANDQASIMQDAPLIDNIVPMSTKEKAILAAANPIRQEEARQYWQEMNPDKFKVATVAPEVPEYTNNNNSNFTFNPEYLRYAPAIGAGLGALTAALQPIDYSFANQLQGLASRVNPIAAPHIGGYRRYNSYDVNLGDAENLAMQATTLRANRGQNRATQGALDVATINAFQRANAQRNLAAQQANEANRLNIDKYNLGINQFNTNLTSAYDQLNTNRLAQRLALEQAAIQAADVSKTAWANNINANTENFFNQLGNVGKDTWNANQYDKWLSQHQAVKNIMTGTSSNVTKIKKLKALGYNDEQIKEIEELYS